MSPRSLRAQDGHLLISGAEPLISGNGVTDPNGRYLPTKACDSDVSAKLGIATAYLRKCRRDAVDLWDTNVNGWLDRAQDTNYLVRAFTGEAGRPGVARALLSDTYKRIDHLDVLTAAMQGIKDAGVPVEIQGCDLTEQRMYIRIFSPAVQVESPALTYDYRSPFTGMRGVDDPIVWGGFVIRNSETGAGAAVIEPRIIFKVCANGQTITSHRQRTVHLGGRIDEGLVNWSEQTLARTLDLITSKTRDAVREFLRPEFVQEVITSMEAKAGVPVTRPEETITTVSQNLRFTEEQRELILDHFMMGAAMSAGGVMHAVTSAAQVVQDGDAAHDMESKALKALHLAAV
ncbi:DUF932 domain-containing protein [Actinomadura hibisca]|uniref:DUF932 domain-containing protein n=1 Tax=Actinomadura hibisca TaxID=68565 RepID=UPI001FE08B6A|nr:DUF932 domain-containing protein [Actinomadura hibisca]